MAARPSKVPDAPRSSFGEQLRSFPGTFWIANWLEVVERFAYYGLRTVVPIYMVLAYEEGGPQFDHKQKGTIFAIWALVQSFVPIFTGGFADRYGYKLNIAISTVIKIAGYIVMGYAIEIGAVFTGLSLDEHQGAAGGGYTYPIFFFGAMLLALGTAIFKPGVQGLIASGMPRSSRSFGWGIFYQMVNIGGFIGPLIAAVLQTLAWKYVFLICAVGITLNFIPLFFFPEPPRREGEGYAGKNASHVIADTIRQFLRPRVLFFTLSFCGFWLMFYQLFDILPNFIDDWVDSTAIAAALEGFIPGDLVPTNGDGNLNQAWMINFNALLIMLFAFGLGFITGKVKSLPAMVAGIAICAAAIFMLGRSMNGWWTIFAIGIFSLGEMTASPTKLRYMNEIAPKGKEGLFLGFANATVGIGWFIGSLVAGDLYESSGDKVNLALKDFAKERDRAEVAARLNEEELVRGYADVFGLSNLQAMTLVFSSTTLEPTEDVQAILDWWKNEWARGDREREAALEGVVGDIAAELSEAIGSALSIPPEHVALLPVAKENGVGDEAVAVARGLLQRYSRTEEEAADLSSGKVVIRLSKELGVSNFATHRLLYSNAWDAATADLDQLRDGVQELWNGSSEAAGVSEQELEEKSALARVLEPVNENGAAAVVALSRRADLPSNLAEAREHLGEAEWEIAAEAEALRGPLLAVASMEEKEEEGDEYIRSLFQRTRVMELAAADAGMTVPEYKRYLWDTYEPYAMWGVFSAIGVFSMVLMLIYDFMVRRYDAKQGELEPSLSQEPPPL